MRGIKALAFILIIIAMAWCLTGCIYGHIGDKSGWLIGQGSLKIGDKKVESKLVPDLSLISLPTGD